MNTDHNETLRAAFGTILTRSRTERKWTAEALAIAGLSDADVINKSVADPSPRHSIFPGRQEAIFRSFRWSGKHNSGHYRTYAVGFRSTLSK